MLSKGNKLYCAFVDFEKCYDYIVRAALFYKLSKLGISSKCIHFYKSMYGRMKSSVKGENRYFTTNQGIYQGEVTSPIFFSLFISDLEENLSESLLGTSVVDVVIRLLSFADDLTIISESIAGLQSGLDKLYIYCRKWGLKLNTHKTKVVVFRKGGKLSRNDKWSYGDNVLECVPCFKYLGCNMSYTGSFAKCTEELLQSARRALFPLKQFCYNNEVLPCIQLKLFNSTIMPVLNYCCELWGMGKSDPIE